MIRQGSRTLFLAAIAILLSGCAARGTEAPGSLAAPVASAALLPGDTLLLQTARAVLRIAPRMARAWPGFWSRDTAFMIYQPGQAVLLVSPSAAPPEFLPLHDPPVPRRLRGRTYLHRGALPGLEGSFHIDYPAGAITATAVALDPEGVPWTLTTLFHEAFHGYQRRRFAPLSSGIGEFVDPAHIAAPGFRAMAELERRMLARSLGMSADSARALLRDYLAVRWMRTRSTHPEAGAVERHLERMEGSAHLLGLEAGLLARGSGRERLPRALRPYLIVPLEDFPGGLPERLIRWRVYGTGAAIGWNLDRLGVQWRRRMEEGAAFDDLLAAAVRFDSSTAPAMAARARERFGFEELLAQAAAAAAATIPSTVEEFHALAPARLTIEFVVPILDGRPDMTLNFDAGAGGFSQLEPNVFGVPAPAVFTLQVPGASLVVRGRPLIQDMRDMHEERLRVTVMLPEVPRLEGGRQLEPPGDGRYAELNLALDGVRLTTQGRVTIDVTSERMLVRPGIERPVGATAASAPPMAELAHLRSVIDATGFAGTVLVRDVRRDRQLAVYGEAAYEGRPPASTFKVLNALIALELGLVEDAESVLPWDGTTRERTELNRDLDLRSAFRLSAVPHFQRLARLTGSDRMRHWLERAQYGNSDIGGGIDEFWLSGSLRISPAEQVRFLDRLRTGALPFSARAQEIVRDIMEVERAANHVLYAKTGWARGDWGSTGWWVGWVERGPDAWVFATVLDSGDPRADFGQQRQAVTRAVLRDIGALP